MTGAPQDAPQRHPIVSLELLFDDDTESRVRAEWDALAAARLSSLAAHTAESNRPHISLLVRPTFAPFDATDVAERLPLQVTLGAPLLFGAGDRRIVVRSVVPSRELLDLHAAVHALAGPGDDAAHTAPGQWMPHVTLARRLKLDDLSTALPLIGGEIAGRITALRRWDAASRTITPLA